MWAYDSDSMVVLGKNQTGKTTVVREIHDRTDRFSIWLNASNSRRIQGISGKTVDSITGKSNSLESCLRQGIQTVEYVPTTDRRTAILELQEWLFDKAERANREFPFQIILDECHTVAPQSQKSDIPHRQAVRQLMKQGVKRNIKTILITQQPVSLDKQCVREAEYRLVFRMSHESQQQFRQYGFDFQQIIDNPDYCGVCHSATGKVIDPQVQAHDKYVQ